MISRVKVHDVSVVVKNRNTVVLERAQFVLVERVIVAVRAAFRVARGDETVGIHDVLVVLVVSNAFVAGIMGGTTTRAAAARRRRGSVVGHVDAQQK